jgi:hypothetical protein
MQQAFARVETLLFDLVKKSFVSVLVVRLKASALNFVQPNRGVRERPETGRLEVEQEGVALCNQSSRQTH